MVYPPCRSVLITGCYPMALALTTLRVFFSSLLRIGLGLCPKLVVELARQWAMPSVASLCPMKEPIDQILGHNGSLQFPFFRLQMSFHH